MSQSAVHFMDMKYSRIYWHIGIVIILLLLSINSMASTTKMDFETKIHGLDGDALKNAKARLKAMQTLPKDQLSLKQIQAYYRQGKKEIAKAIAPYGYFAPSIGGSLNQHDHLWTANYIVVPGNLLKVTKLNIRIEGPGKAQLGQNLQAKTLSLQQGKTFTTTDYQQTLSHLLDTANHLGYIRAELSHNQIIIDKNAYTCAVNITLDSGKRYYFGKVNFSSSPFKDSFLQRFVDFKPGDVYQPSKVKALQRTLVGTGYFSNVIIAPEIAKANAKDWVPLQVDLEKNKRRLYRIGLGFGTGTGARVTLGTNWRWVNKAGHQFNMRLQASDINNSFSAQYLIPGRHPSTEKYSLSTTTFQLTPQNAESIGVRSGIAYLIEKGVWRKIYGLNYLYENYRYFSGDSYQNVQAVLPAVTWQRNKADRDLNPSRANEFSLSVTGSSEKVGSSLSFAQATISEKVLWPLGHNLRLLLRGTSGNTLVSEQTELPVSISYYTGGSQSVRGYDNQDLGPGIYLLIASAELRRRLIGHWWATAFIDEGNAFNHYNNMALQRGIGAGIIWQSPVGPITVSVAQAATKANKPWMLQFNMGQL